MADEPYLYPEDIDTALSWPLGTAARLARRRRLPHYLLPDGSIRFRRSEIDALIQHVLPIAEQDRPENPDRVDG